MMSLNFGDLLSVSKQLTRKQLSGRRQFRSAFRRYSLSPTFESLEQRALLAVVTWDGGGDGITWEDPANWDTNVLPTAADDVIIADLPSAGGTYVTLNSSQQINSLNLLGSDIFQLQFVSLELNPLISNIDVTTTIDLTHSELRLVGTSVAADSVNLGAGSFLSGVESTIFGDVINNQGGLRNAIELGFGPFVISGNYTQGPNAEFFAAVDPIANRVGQVQVLGIATLDGLLTLTSSDPLDFSQSFDVLTFGSSSGTFQSLSWGGPTSFRLDTPFTFALNANTVELTGAVHVVSTAADSGPTSLREAILNANAQPTAGLIGFRSTVGTISLNSPLPEISNTIEINATVLGNYLGTPLIELDGTFAGPAADGLRLGIGSSGSVVSGLAINRFSRSGIWMESSANEISSNYIGTDLTGTNDLGNNENGIHVLTGSNGNLIRNNVVSGNNASGILLYGNSNKLQGNRVGTNAAGTGNLGNSLSGVWMIGGSENSIGVDGDNIGDTNEGNLISGNGSFGIVDLGINTQIRGNYVGTQIDGLSALANVQGGISLTGSSAVVGGTDTASRNIISGNVGFGISISGVTAVGNTILGNFIGVDRDGAQAVPNTSQGVLIHSGASNNTIGGAAIGARNVISGNSVGVGIADANTTTVSGNFIGLAADGTTAIANTTDGVVVSGAATETTIGGSTFAERNYISGNTRYGVVSTGPGSGTIISGNIIGLNTLDEIRGNATAGILNNSGSGITVGGATLGSGNVISGNGRGVWLQATSENTILGNFIGTDSSGTVARPNDIGILIAAGSADNIIGGRNAGERNIVSGNTTDGIFIRDVSTSRNQVQGNFIGVDVTGNIALGNRNGVLIRAAATGNIIGGGLAGSGNVISGNTFAGVVGGVSILDPGTSNNRVQGNYIGTDMFGGLATPNTIGVLLNNASDNFIGTDGDGVNDSTEGNLISGNNLGMYIVGNADRTIIAGNLIGTNATGTSAIGNNTGIQILNSTVDGTRIGTNADGVSDELERNIISGNAGAGGGGISDRGTGTIVSGNFIGTDTSGQNSVPNRYGIQLEVSASGSRIGTNADGVRDEVERNIISGNNVAGVHVTSAGVSGVTIAGNYIGTTATGLSPLPNLQHGISLDSSSTGTIVGGSIPSARNIISGNAGAGVLITNSSSSNTLLGNYIGVDRTGTASLANGLSGVLINNSASGNLVGGNSVDARNIISGNARHGVEILGTTNNTVAGNFIGVDQSGNERLGNALGGVVLVSAVSTIVGGPTSTSRNVISGNGRVFGINATNTTDVTVQNNFIGTNAVGDVAVGNLGGGVVFQGTNVGTLIQSNVVSGNLSNFSVGGTNIGSGIEANNAMMLGNIVGLNATGTATLGNAAFGINGSGNAIGGNGPGDRNVISGNFNDGIVAGSNSIIRGNFIGTDATGTLAVGNDGLGILVVGASNVVEENTVATNSEGELLLVSGASLNQVIGNRLGIGVIGSGVTSGGVTVESVFGIRLDGAFSNTIGSSAQPNVIGLMSAAGIDLRSSSGNNIEFNLIGVNEFGHALPNGVGVRVDTTSSSNSINDNIVRFSTGDNFLVAGPATVLRRNRSADMGGKAIRLDPASLAPGSVAITGVVGGNNPLVQGEFTAEPNSAYTLDLFSSAVESAAEQYVASASATTDNTGFGTFSVSPATGVLNGYVTATLSGLGDGGVSSTSELSASVLATPAIILGLRGQSPEGTPITLTAFASTNPVVGYLWTVTKDGEPYAFEARADGTQSDGGIQFTPNDEGLYTVSLRVTLEDGSNVLLGPYAINVFNVEPTPAFEYSPTLPAAGQLVTLTANSNDPGEFDLLTSTWEVRQGSPTGTIVFSSPASQSNTTAFTPTGGGFYYVTLTVDDGDGGQSSLTRELEVSGMPIEATIILSETVVREGDTVRARAPEAELNRTEQLSFAWTLTRTSASTTVVYSFTVPAAGVIEFIPDDDGVYTVGLTVSDSSGSVVALPQVVHVGNVAPILTLVSSTAPALNVPQTFAANIFDRGVADTHLVEWTVELAGQVTPVAFGSGTSFTFTPTVAGVYVVSAEAADDDDGHGSSRASFTIAEDGMSLSILAPNGPFFEGNSYNFAALVPAGVVSYAWQALTANAKVESISDSSSFVFIPQQGGDYLIELSVAWADGRSLSTSVGPIAVQATGPTINSLAVVSPITTPIYEGTAVTVRAEAVDPREPIGLNYLWEFKKPGETEFTSLSGVVGQPRDFQFIPEDDGQYEVRLTVRDSQGILVQQTLPVSILNAEPIVRLEAQHLSVSGEVQFVAVADDPGALDRPELQYAWRINGDDFVVGSKFFTTSLAGLAEVAVQVTDGDGGTKEISYVVVQGLGSSDTIVLDSNTEATVNGTSISIGGGPGPILVLGLAGDDEIVIRAAVSRSVLVLGGTGNDTIDASATSIGMILDGGAGDDTILGGSGDDLLIAGPDENFLHGGAGNNYFLGGGDDTMIGLGGNDYYHVHFSTVVLEDTGGNDIIDLTDAKAGVTFNLSDNGGAAQNVFASSTLSITGDFETLIGSTHDDILTSTTSDTVLRGGEGNDTLISSAPNVTLDGGEGDDRFLLNGASGTIVSNTGDNTVEGSLSTALPTRIALGDGDDLVDITGGSLAQLSQVSLSLGGGENELFAQYISGSIYAAEGSDEGSISAFGAVALGSSSLVVNNSIDIDIFGGVATQGSITVGSSSDIEIYGGGAMMLDDTDLIRIEITDFGTANPGTSALLVTNNSDIEIFGATTGNGALTATLTNSSDIEIFGSANNTTHELTLNGSSDIEIYGIDSGSIALNNVVLGINRLELGLFGSSTPTTSQLAVRLNGSSDIDIFGSAVSGSTSLTLNSSSEIDIFGTAAGNITIAIDNSSDIGIFGTVSTGSLSVDIINGSSDIEIFGTPSTTGNAIRVEGSSNIDIFGSTTSGSVTFIVEGGSSDIDIFGSSTPAHQTISVSNSSEIDIFGGSSPGGATLLVQNSNDVDIFGSISSASSTITVNNGSDIDIFGSASTGNVAVAVTSSQDIGIFGSATSGATNIAIDNSSDVEIFGAMATGTIDISVSGSRDIDIFGSAGRASMIQVTSSQDVAIYGGYGDSIGFDAVERGRIEGGVFGLTGNGGLQVSVTGNSTDIDIFGTELLDEVSITSSRSVGMNLRGDNDQVDIESGAQILVLTDAGDDVVTVSSGNDMLIYLGAGNDRAEVLDGSNIRVIGESDDDQLVIGGGNNLQLDGGDGDDQMFVLGSTGIQIRGDGGADQIHLFAGVGVQASAGVGDDLLQLFGSFGGALSAGTVYALLDGQDGNDTLEVRPLLSVADRGSIAVASNDFPHLYLPGWVTVPTWLASPQQTSFPSSIAVVGGVGNDRLWLEGDSRLIGLGGDGDDQITLHRGTVSEVAGGQGFDELVINAAGTDNRVFGDQGDDQITVNNGLRLGLFGQEGNDAIRILGGQLVFARGGAGDDQLEIHAGESNVLSGEEGADRLLIYGGLRGVAAGGSGDDELDILGGDFGLLLGQSGRDVLRLTGGRISILSGGDGDDSLEAWGRNADLYGDDGDDTYQLLPATMETLVDTSLLRIRELVFATSSNIETESRGADTVDLSSFGSEATIDLGTTGLINDPVFGLQSVVAGQLELILLGSIENVVGTEFDDLLIGSREANLLDGRGGNDELRGLEGDDILIGGGGNDLLIGSTGNDQYVFATEDNVSLGSDAIHEDVDGGVDVLDFRGLPVGLGTLDLNLAALQTLAGSLLQLTLLSTAGTQPAEVEEVVGTEYNDTLIGNNSDNRFELLSGFNVVDGRGGSDIYLFSGAVAGTTTITDSPTESGRDTLDFAGFDFPIGIDLAITSDQTLGPLTLTLTSASSVENVVGTSFDDRILGNGLHNTLYGAGGSDVVDGRGGDDKLIADLPQIVLLDFDSAYRAERGDYDYSADERDAILTRVANAFGPFNWLFTLSEPEAREWSSDMGRNFVRLEFSKGRGGGVSGDAGEIDFRNVQRRVISEVNVNPLLPTVVELLIERHGPGYTTQQYSEMVVALTSTIAAHELGHTAGLRHGDAFGPIGTGLFAATPTNLMFPEYRGTTAADETPWHIIASPLSVGSTIEDATRLTYFGAREAIKLAFNEIGTTRREQAAELDSHGSIVTAEDLGELESLTVPNLTPSSDFSLFGQTFSVHALTVVGELRSQTIASEEETEFDYYRFTGKAGDIVNIELLANSLRPLRGRLFDGELRVYKADGTEIAFNDDDFEGTKDATILDLILEEDGEYFVAVGLSVSPAILSGGGRYELFLSRFSVGEELVVSGDTLISGSGNGTMHGSAADDLFLAAGATLSSVLVLDGRGGIDTLDTLGIPFTYNAASIEIVTGTLNTPPVVSITAPAAALVGETINVTFHLADVDAVDASGPFTLLIEWGDDSEVETVTLPAGTMSIVVPHVFDQVPAAGQFEISVTAVDGRGASSQPATARHVSTGWSVMADPLNPSQTILVIVGTPDSDLIRVRQNGNNWVRIRVRNWEGNVRIRGRVDGGEVSRLLVHGLDGHDIIDLHNVNVAAQIWGGGGNDLIQGGSGHDVIWGGAGSDIIDGGHGRDIVIGGTGADLLLGDQDDDILVAGLTAFDQEFNRLAPDSHVAGSRLDFNEQRLAIQAIMAEWTSNRSYVKRRNNIMGVGSGPRNNQTHYLKSNASQIANNAVFDDGATDHLFGLAGQDWFFAHTWKPGRCRIDLVWDRASNETTSDIDWWWE